MLRRFVQLGILINYFNLLLHNTNMGLELEHDDNRTDNEYCNILATK